MISLKKFFFVIALFFLFIPNNIAFAAGIIGDVRVQAIDGGVMLIVTGQDIPNPSVTYNKDLKVLAIILSNTSYPMLPWQQGINTNGVMSAWANMDSSQRLVFSIASLSQPKWDIRRDARGYKLEVIVRPTGKNDMGPMSPVTALKPRFDSFEVLPVSDGVQFIFKGQNLPAPVLNMREKDMILDIVFQGILFPRATQRRIDTNGIVSIWTDPVAPADKALFHVALQNKVRTSVDSPAGANDIKVTLHLMREVAPKPNNQGPATNLTSPVTSLKGRDPMTIGTPVTLDFRDTDIRDVLRALAKISESNIVLDPSVSGTVTLTVKDVPYREAFSLLLRMYNLSYYVSGGTIFVGDKVNLGKMMGPEIRKEYLISYGDLAVISGLLKEAVGVEKIYLDDRMHTLYIEASASKHEEVAEFLKSIDAPGKQVMLEAKMIEVSDKGRQELSGQLEAYYDYWWKLSSQTGTITFDPYPINSDGGVDINLPAIRNKIKVLMTALETKDNTKVVAEPRVMTLDGKKAVIQLTKTVKYISGRDDAGNPTYSDITTGPTLSFLPRVGRDGFISLTIDVSTGDYTMIGQYVEGQLSEIPETSKTSVQTEVRVRNGEPIVIGGLFRENEFRNLIKFPILGDLPILGTFFRSDVKGKNRGEVVILVIPTLVD